MTWCTFAYKKQWRNLQIETFLESEKLRFKIIRLRFQGYRCKSGIAIFAWKVTFTLTVPLTMTNFIHPF